MGLDKRENILYNARICALWALKNTERENTVKLWTKVAGNAKL